jgi:hypothetical protein
MNQGVDRMLFETTARTFAKCISWGWIPGAYFGCLAPIWVDGLSCLTACGSLCFIMLLTYALMRIRHDLRLLENRLARFISRLRP